MEESKSLFEKYKNDIQKEIEKSVSFDTNNTQANGKAGQKLSYEQVVSQQILAKYNREGNSDFQNELREMIAPMTIEKVKALLDGKENRKKDEQQRQELVEKESQTLEKQGIAVDEKAKEQARKEKGQDENIDLQAIVLKSAYESTMQEYYKLKNDLQAGVNGQMYTGDVSVPDKMSTRLVLYENALRKMDMQYKSHTGHFIVNDDKDVSKNENNMSYRNEKNESAINNRALKNLERLNELHEQQQEISDSIVYLSGMSANMDPEEFKSQMDVLQKRYIDKSVEISELEPNPVEFNRQLDAKQAEEEYRQRTVGSVYERQKNRTTGVAANVVGLDKGNDIREHKLNEQANRSDRDISAENKQKVEELLKEFQSEFDKGYFQKAEETLQSAEAIAGIELAERGDGNVSSRDINNKGQQKKEYENALDEQLDNAVVPEEELANRDALKIRASEVAKKAGAIGKENEQRDKNIRVR